MMATKRNSADRKQRFGLGTRMVWAGLTATALVLASIGPAQAVDLSQRGGYRGIDKLCSGTSKVARKACQFDIRDDYWIATGVCANLIDDDARGECADENRAVLQEGRELCTDQYHAREELCDALGQEAYDPLIDPDDYVDPLAVGASVAPNPYFPLVPGTYWNYASNDGEVIEIEVTDDTIEIQGVECIVVHDVVSDAESGEIIEDTLDWYAQDLDGNVWYFGELSQNFEDGTLVDIEGSWTAGVDGAKAGVLMEAGPQVGDVYRQEWALGDAEDVAEVVHLNATVTDPESYCSGTCLKTMDFSPIEPGVFEFKYHAPGKGTVLIENPDTGVREWLVETNLP